MSLPLSEISALVEEVLAAEGARLVELAPGGSARKPVLRLYVDHPDGTSAQVCESISRRLEARLDASCLLGERYVLEVSSPGLDRPLRTRRDFERLLGREVKVRRRADGSPGDVIGVLDEVRDAAGGAGAGFAVVVRPSGGERVRIDCAEIAEARPHLRW
jgi:ribosome maturation factor RimP